MNGAVSASEIKRLAKSKGMRVFGNFLFAIENYDVISGLVIDAPPSRLHLWTFILPAFDEISFLHMGLGERLSPAGGGNYFDQALNFYKEQLGNVVTAGDLIHNLECRKLQGFYAKWARLLCHVRIGEFSDAELLMSELDTIRLPDNVRKQLFNMRFALDNGGWLATQQLLNQWAIGNREVLGKAR